MVNRDPSFSPSPPSPPHSNPQSQQSPSPSQPPQPRDVQQPVAIVVVESTDQVQLASTSPGRPRYESIRNDSSDPDSLAPNRHSGPTWVSLTRQESEQSARDDEDDRAALTRPPLLSIEDSQDDLLPRTRDDGFLSPEGFNPRTGAPLHEHEPTTSSIGSFSSRRRQRSSQSTVNRLATVKQVLGRASTRVINLSGSSRSQPSQPSIASIPDSASVLSGRSKEEIRSSTDSALNDQNGPPTAGLIQPDPSKNSAHSPPHAPPTQSSPNPPPVSDLPWSEPPLEGYSLFIFGPRNKFRQAVQRFGNQTWVELTLLLLLVLNLLFLVVEVSSERGNATVWGAHWTDYGLFVIFILYTIEIGSRIIVSGMVLYPEDGDKIRRFFGRKPRTDNLHDTNPTILRKSPHAYRVQTSLTPASTMKPSEPKFQTTLSPASTLKSVPAPHPAQSTPAGRATTIIDFAVGRQTTVMQFIPESLDPLLAYKPQFLADQGPQIPFLRHTFNRIDFIAVVCYWIDFCLMLAGVQHIYFFKTIAAMRTLRLLNITSGSATILHSLKKSAPLLVNIVLFIAFFFVIFSIIGVQAFKGSLSRHCVSETDSSEALTDEFCGGHYNISASKGISSYIMKDNTSSPTGAKGNICAVGYICKDIGINYEGAISFDTIYSAMVPVYVLMTGQTWTDMMYKVMDAEYAWSSLYFVMVVLVMNFWILNLFIAVINEMFAKIRDDSDQNSAFTSDKAENKNAILSESVNNFTYNNTGPLSQRMNWVKSFEFIWVVAVVVDLVFQCLPRYNSLPSSLERLDRIEFWFTIAFALDILIRFLVYLPTPKGFFKSKKNKVDLFLAVATLIIQIPPIHNSRAYVYLTVFQVVRIYRPIIYIERLRSLIRRVVGSWIGLLNLIFFIAMFLAVVSVMAGLLFREIVDPDKSHMNFSDFYISYLGMYQVFSGENWTTILYNVIAAEVPWRQAIVSTVFIIAFYSFANFVLVNMLIAIIMENFEGGVEAAKHTQQILDFAEQAGYSKEEERKFVIYLTKYLKPYPKSIGLDITQSGWINRMRKGIARQFLLGDQELFHGTDKNPLEEASDKKAPTFTKSHRRESSQKSDFRLSQQFAPSINTDTGDTDHFRELFTSPTLGQREHHPEPTANLKGKSYFSKEAMTHRSLFLFGPDNDFRRLLQRFVTPGRGYRLEGEAENVLLSRPFNLLVTLGILACVLVAAITTPVWRLKESALPKEDQSVVIKISDYVFPGIFTIEFLIRVIADGLFFTPDAYMQTLWNKIDFFVLLTLYAPLVANLAKSQGASRFFRSLKALRALRLINQSSYIKGTFHAVLVAGFPQLMDATMLSMSLIVPFAIYGMRLFSGLFYSCNDKSPEILTVDQCVGTFLSADTNLTMPRVWANPDVYSFDNFGSSFLILFEIVSQEGWTGVMESARDITGLGQQPAKDASRYNGVFFVIYNLAGGYFVSALFVAIVIENYTKRTGTAFMTANQRRWMDLKKLLGGIKMSKSRSHPPMNSIRAYCYKIATPKRGWFPRLLTIVTILNGIMLATEHVDSDWEGTKNWLFLTLTAVFMIEIVVKVAGLGWTGYRKNRWNIYNSTVSLAAFLITIMRVCGVTWQPLIQTQKLFLTAILFRLVQRSDSLNQLFMTMAASMNSISSLLGVWLVVFAVYGIMFVEIFGLTTYGPNGSDHVNFRNIGVSLLMMARMSTGEGWNDLMHDFAVERPNCVNEPNNYLLSDCGSTAWSYALFITFNIISMYIFTNMFIVVVMHNFSYVYQIAPGFSLINREEIRGFKRVWAEVDDQHTGYIQEKDLGRFLMKLRGVFDMRLYSEDHSLVKLQSRLETIKPSAVNLSAQEIEKKARANETRKVLMLNETNRRSTLNWGMDENRQRGEAAAPAAAKKVFEDRPNLAYKIYQDYNLDAFNSAIANMDREQVRRRRRLYNFLFVEAVMSMEPIPGSENEKNKKRAPLLRWRSIGFEKDGTGVGGVGGDYEMGEIGGEMREAQRGISFQKMLIIMAHYKLIEDDQCLSIGDLLRHRQKMDRIHAKMNVISVKSVLLKVILRQRFLKHYRAVQRIRAMAGETPPQSNARGGGRAGGAGGYISKPSAPTRPKPAISHLTHASDATDKTMTSTGAGAPGSTGQKRVRIFSGDESATASGVGSSSSMNTLPEQSTRRLSSFGPRAVIEGEKTEMDELEAIEPEQAAELIASLRSEWRSFISSHDLSMDQQAEEQEEAARRRLLESNEFENVDMARSSDGRAPPARSEVLGVDFL